MRLLGAGTGSGRQPVGSRPQQGLRSSLAVLLVALLVASAAVGCSDDEPDTPQDATARMTEILGRAPEGLAATVAERGKLRVAVTADDPPRSYKDDDELVGFDVDVAASVAGFLGVEPVYSQQPPEAVPPGLTTDRFDVSIGSLGPNDDAADDVAYSDPYYYTTGQLLVQTGGPRVQGSDDLAGLSVGAGVHTVFFRFLRDQTEAQPVAFPGDAEALAALEAGRVEAVLLGGLTAAEAVEEGRGVELSGPPLYSEPMVFVVKSGEDDLLAVLNEAIATRRREGALEELSETWFGGLDLTRPAPASTSSP